VTVGGRENREKYDRTLQTIIFTAAVNETNNMQTKYKSDQILLHSIFAARCYARARSIPWRSVCLSGWLDICHVRVLYGPVVR